MSEQLIQYCGLVRELAAAAKASAGVGRIFAALDKAWLLLSKEEQDHYKMNLLGTLG